MTTTVPPYTFGGITRPALILDDTGHIVLFGAAADFAATYGLKALYVGLPPGTPYPPVTDSLSTPTDSNGGLNSVAEGAAANTAVGITASATSAIGTVTYSLVGDNSGGGFKINATTGVVTVNDPTKIDFESAPGHAYTINVQASDGIITSTHAFTINVTDVAPSAPTDTDGNTNTVAEGAAANTAVGVTAHSTDVNGGTLTYAITNDTSGGGFKIDVHTGVVTVSDPTKIDFESTAPGHTYTITVQSSDGALQSTTQTFTIGVTDIPLPTPTDTDAATNTVAEGATTGTHVGLTVSAVDPNGPTTHYSILTDNSGGGFAIDTNTGVVTVADASKINFEGAPSHTYTIQVKADDGLASTTQNFNIAVSDVAPPAPFDNDPAANTVVEGASGGTAVGITALSPDVNGGTVVYSLTNNAGGAFSINSSTGAVNVADPTKIDFESTGPGHTYTITVQASDGTLSSTTQDFTIAVTDAPPSQPVDSDLTANSVAEGAASGTGVGIMAVSSDPNGPPVTYSLIGDPTNGGFAIDPTSGVITVADGSKIDYESSAPGGHAYILNVQASDGAGGTSSQFFTVNVTNVAPSQPTDNDPTANSVVEGAGLGTTVGVTAHATDPSGGTVTYAKGVDSSAGGFAVDSTTGVITVADPTKIDFETSGASHSYTVTVVASDGLLQNSQTFTIGVTDVAPTTPVDSDGGAVNQVSQNAPVGTYTGLTASSTDVNGPAVTYSILTDTSGGGFAIDSSGKVTVADPTKIPFNAASPSFDVTVRASDGTDHADQTFTINIIQNTPPVANDDSLAATEAGGANNAVPGSNPSGNVVLGTGSAGAVQDTDAQDLSSALTVVAVHTGPESGSTGTGTVGQDLTGSHGILHLNSDGSYTYAVNQTDAQVQALHTSADTITDVFNYTIQDTGGLQDTAQITFTIHGQNDLPVAVADTGAMTEDDAPTSFNVIANDSPDPDSTAANTITVGPGGVTVAGPAGETFANTDATASIVSNEVQVTLNNAHFQQLRAGETATVTVPYTLTGDAGETSSASLVVTVNGVNDVPVAADDSGTMTEDQSGHAFTVLTNDTIDPDHTAPNNVTVGAVTNLVAPSGENIDLSDISVSVNGSNQVVVNLGSDFQHMQDGQSTTFDVAYTLHGDQPGDTSTAELHVTVTGLNDAPTAGNFTFNGTSSATGNTDLIVHDPANAATTETTPNKTISGSLLSGASDVDGPGPLIVVAGNIATAHGGSVTMQSDGDFIYKPPVGYTGSDSFTYQVSDQNAGASGVGLGTGTVTINVAAPHVWYVNASAAAGGDGSSENPFNDLSHFNGAGGVDSAGDTIFLEGSGQTYTAPAGGLQLENNEQLISQSAGLVVPDGSGGAGTVTLVSASGSNSVVNGGVVLANGNNIQGIDFGSSSTFSISGNNVGTSTIDNVKQGVINNTGSGGAVSITGSGNALTYDFGSVTSSGGTNGISITGASGTFHSHGGTISGASGADVSLSSGTLNFTQDGAISDATGTVVSISSMTAGTQSFTGAIGTTGSTDGAISLTSNTGATINFSGGIALSTGSAAAFSASGGGTVNVTGTNHLTTTTGTALNVQNTTIGTSGLTFHDVSSNGAANGIVLNNTGSGSLTVTGDGGVSSNHSGGQIVGSTGSGVSLTTTGTVTLGYLDITNSGTDGVNASGVNGFTLNRSNVSDNGGGAADEGLELTNMSGTVAVSNSAITNAPHNGIFLHNTDTNLTAFNVTNTTITDSTPQALGNDGILVETSGSTVLSSANISGSTISNMRATGVQVSAEGTSRIGFAASGLINGTSSTADDAANSITVQNNTFSNNNIGVDFSQSQTSNEVFQLLNNTITGNHSHAINVASAAGADTGPASHYMVGKIDSNTIGTQGTLDSGSAIGNGLRVAAQGDNTQWFLTVNNNTFHEVANQDVISFIAQDGAGVTSHGTTADFKITNNTVTAATGTAQFGGTTQGGLGIFVLADEGVPVHTVITGNNIHTTNPAGEFDVYLAERTGPPTGSSLSVEGTGSVSSFIIANNTLNDTNKFFDEEGNATLAVPGSGTFPLLAGPGGVQATTPTSGETHLTQAELDSVVAAAIAQWEAAGASASQIAALKATTFSVADLSSGTIGQESSPAHITIDVNADGHGWFVDPTPGDNSEFTHAQNAAGTDLLTDPSNPAASHLDLLTTVTHEMGHVLGLPDETAPSQANDLMYINLADGERRLPDAGDVAKAAGAPANADTSVVPAWTDHLVMHSDNFNFTPPPPPAPIAIAVPLIGGAAAPHVPSPGVTAPAGDSFHWATTDTHAGSVFVKAFTDASSAPHATIDPGVTIASIGEAFNWPPALTTDIHTAIVHDTIVGPVASILPDLHTLAATVPSMGGFIIH